METPHPDTSGINQNDPPKVVGQIVIIREIQETDTSILYVFCAKIENVPPEFSSLQLGFKNWIPFNNFPVQSNHANIKADRLPDGQKFTGAIELNKMTTNSDHAYNISLDIHLGNDQYLWEPVGVAFRIGIYDSCEFVNH